VANFCDRHEDLKQMLDSSKDNLKLEAMKRIIGVSNIAFAFIALSQLHSANVCFTCKASL